MNTLSLGLKYFFIDLVGGILRWPLWWYTKGMALIFRWAVEAVKTYSKTIAVGVWIKNIFVPMYGARDWQSRIISVFMRVVQIVARSFALAAWLLIVTLAVIAYVVLPIISVIFALLHASAVII